MIREFSAGIIVYRLRRKIPRYLILHYEEGHWDFPKGHIEKGEHARDAALRETAEETGLHKLELGEDFRERLSYFYRLKGKGGLRFKVVTFFLARLRGRERVRLSHEHLGYKWLGYEEAKRRLTFKNAQGMLGKAQRFLARKSL